MVLVIISSALEVASFSLLHFSKHRDLGRKAVPSEVLLQRCLQVCNMKMADLVDHTYKIERQTTPDQLRTTCKCKYWWIFNFTLFLSIHQTAKLNSPPNFPVYDPTNPTVLISLFMCSDYKKDRLWPRPPQIMCYLLHSSYIVTSIHCTAGRLWLVCCFCTLVL